ncbi:MAG: hypothetical protein ACNA8W_02195 [Bradymonadaceae bacterium]
MEDRNPDEEDRRRIPRELPFILLGVLLALELYRRLFLGYIPHDFGAYLAAADTFSRGLDPYSEAIFDSPLYQGYPYIYAPASLYLTLLVSHLPTVLVTALDAILRMAIFIASMGWLQKKLQLRPDLPTLLFVGCFFAPFAFDFMTGNLETYMFFGLIVVVGLADRSGIAVPLLGGVIVGLLLFVKPMWLIAAVAALVALRGWLVLTGLIAGAMTATAVSLASQDLYTSWLARLGEVREFYGAVNYLEFSPWLYGLAIFAWAGAGLWILKTRGFGGDTWIYACTSIVIWPRIDLYSYMILLPVLLFLWRELGGVRAMLIALPLVGPLPWVLASYDRIISLTVLLVWASICAALVASVFIVGQEERSSRRL